MSESSCGFESHLVHHSDAADVPQRGVRSANCRRGHSPGLVGRRSRRPGRAHGAHRLPKQRGVSAMNTKTEARNEIQEPVAPQVSGIDSNDQDRQHHGGLWVLAVALVAFAGLAAAVAIEVFDGSNANDAVTTVSRGPEARLGLPPHPRAAVAQGPDPGRVRQRRLPPDLRAAVARGPDPVESDNDDYLRISGQLSPRTSASRPSTRTSSGRPTRPPRRKRRRWFARFGSTRPARWSRPDPGLRTRPTDPPGSAARPASGSQGGQPTRWPHLRCGQRVLRARGQPTVTVRTRHLTARCARIGGHGDVRGGRRGAVAGPRLDP